jgi:hypothetical protein
MRLGTSLDAFGLGGIKLLIDGMPGDVVEVHSTSDLLQWSSLTARTNWSGTIQFNSPRSIAPQFEFFRAVVKP